MSNDFDDPFEWSSGEEYQRGRDHILDKAEVMDRLNAFLKECPPWIIEKGVAHLKTILDEPTRGMIFIKWHDDHAEWWAFYHHGWGTAIRNSLRDHVCKDDQLPSGNWDDYYIQLVEIACGARKYEKR